MPRQCNIPDCGNLLKYQTKRPPEAQGWCRPHYRRWRRFGDPLYESSKYIKGPIPLRFWSKVEFTETCWIWTGAKNGNDYGHFTIDGSTFTAHRWAYEFCVGPIPEGLTIDHLCYIKLCVNPDHLEAVTIQENLRRYWWEERFRRIQETA